MSDSGWHGEHGAAVAPPPLTGRPTAGPRGVSTDHYLHLYMGPVDGRPCPLATPLLWAERLSPSSRVKALTPVWWSLGEVTRSGGWSP